MNKFKTISLAASTMLALAFTLSCSSDEEGGYACSADFEEVTIGTQTWMAENLNCDVNGSLCYDNNPANCDKYGRLYNWETAKKVCPSGWHLPDTTEWKTLINFAGGSSVAGKELKATSGWEWNNNNEVPGDGTDQYNFAALPGGFSLDGRFDNVGYSGIWWSATKLDDSRAYSYAMSWVYDFADGSGKTKDINYSVRCVKD